MHASQVSLGLCPGAADALSYQGCGTHYAARSCGGSCNAGSQQQRLDSTGVQNPQQRLLRQDLLVPSTVATSAASRDNSSLLDTLECSNTIPNTRKPCVQPSIAIPQTSLIPVHEPCVLALSCCCSSCLLPPQGGQGVHKVQLRHHRKDDPGSAHAPAAHGDGPKGQACTASDQAS